MPQMTFWYEFASTYSYLSAARIAPLAARYQVEIVWQPFLLGPIFAAQGWHTSPFNIYPAKGDYMWRDLARQIDKYDLPALVRPEVFPQNGLLAARVAQLGQQDGWIAAFSRGVYHAQFAQGVSIAEEGALARILSGLGLDAAGILARAKTDPKNKAALRRATEKAQSLGIFGAPSFATRSGDLFWGDDRLEDALADAAR
ncbi:MAG: 2-hydroxychromene-2-carboxylate isomerase [Sulfitobacter sp.]